MDEVSHMRANIEEIKAANLENETNCQLYAEQVNLKVNSTEFSELILHGELRKSPISSPSCSKLVID